MRRGALLRNRQVSPLENWVVAEVVAQEQVLREYLEQIYSANLLLELRAVVKHDVFAVGRQLEKRLSNVVPA